MPKIIQLDPHVANLIAAGEVVERPASVVKELLENAVDAGAKHVTVEIRDGGMTFIRVTDDGCGMVPEDARTAFLRHATSKLRTAEDLAAISTMGFRGEALAAIASVSRIDLMTKTEDMVSGTNIILEGGVISEEADIGCPQGTTIIVRDLFFNTPARMKFMKTDTVEGSRVSAIVQQQALAHPEVAFRFLRDGKEILSTPGNGQLEAAVYCIYGRDGGKMVKVDSHWEQYTLTGYVSKPTDARPSRNLQTFFVNDRPVKSRLLISAFEEAYRNQLMVGKFPTCVLHLQLPATMVDVNVHPAKTEVKFLNEKAVFDCVHYGVLGALNKTPDRPQIQFKPAPTIHHQVQQKPTVAPQKAAPLPQKQENFFRTMTAEEYKNFSAAVSQAPQPKKETAVATVFAVERTTLPVREEVRIPVATPIAKPTPIVEEKQVTTPSTEEEPVATAVEESTIQEVLDMPAEIPWRYVGELYNSYIIVEQGDEAFLIDKHAAHERILFEKLKKHQEEFSSQTLLTPVPCKLSPDEVAAILNHAEVIAQLGFEVDEFGENTLLIRQAPMDLGAEEAADTLTALAANLLNGRQEDIASVRDEVLHTVACKAAIKAGWRTNEKELQILVKAVMENEELKYCPHGRPICITLSKKQLEKQFKRS